MSRMREISEWVGRVKEQTGKGLLTQAREIYALRRYGGQCGVSDYYWYRLYDSDYLNGDGQRDFLGWRLQSAISDALNPRYAVLPAVDKITFALIAHAVGLPIAPVRACFKLAKQLPEDMGIHLKSVDQAAAFLRDRANYPMFGKPSFSQQGYGAASLSDYDPATDTIRLLDGEKITVPDFVRRLEQPIDPRYHKPQCGYIFQHVLQLAPEIATLTQWPALCSVRVICLNGPDDVRPVRAIWKIATPPNYVDNFSLGAKGNMLADVDLKTGHIKRVVNAFWPHTALIDRHPTSGMSFEGFQLPGWDKVLEACRLGGTAFPLMKIHHWDFALTDRGPVILELNSIGATELAQVHGNGLLTNETRQFLKIHGDKRQHAWINAL